MNLRSGNNEQGIVIMLVAVVMLFVVGAMAALSIDVVTLYTARSEAQLAADAAALAGARVLANSGMTSASTTALGIAAVPMATTVATQVAASNQVGGRNLNAAGACTAIGEICININPGALNFLSNPKVTVQVQRTDLPTFFARIWGRTMITVRASATAEAYNPSNAPSIAATPSTPVAPTCVKPWLLPNLDPSNPTPGSTIFDSISGSIQSTSLLGWSYNTAAPVGKAMGFACGVGGNCTTPLPAPTSWQYYPGDDATTFPHPTSSLPSCNPALTTNYQESIAGCIQTPISCNSLANIDVSAYGALRNADTTDAVTCLTHATNNAGDTVTSTYPPTTPFEFIAGADNPVVNSVGNTVMVSSSLVTVPIFDVNTFNSGVRNVQIIGFLQLFLNPDGLASPVGSVD
ncbi:MAG: hypothetical protein LAO30_10865, partial [Acidobacteriia bacterium]|nr:hypothetical protein [Terriglobia bacterium]